LLQTIPGGPDTHVVLMHVVESAAGRYLGEESSDQETRAERRSLDTLAEAMRGRGIDASVALGHGDAATELARIVREWSADLLVAGSHGHQLVGDLVFGSTTSRLRHRIRCPMLIVPSARVPREGR
jgi:manganese transport protein